MKFIINESRLSKRTKCSQSSLHLEHWPVEVKNHANDKLFFAVV